MTGSDISDLFLIVGVPIGVWLLSAAMSRRLRRRVPRKRPSVVLLYSACACAIWLMHHLGLLSDWAAIGLTAGLAAGYLVSPNDDDDHRGRRRRLGNALKQARQWLARGIPARSPQAPEGVR